jgi:hypothetical protein
MSVLACRQAQFIVAEMLGRASDEMESQMARYRAVAEVGEGAQPESRQIETRDSTSPRGM